MSKDSGSGPRNIVLKCAVSEKEREKICADAQKAGMKISRYMRLTLMGAVVQQSPEADVPFLINEVRKVGMALDRLIEEAEEQLKISEEEFKEILEENRRVEKLILEAYGTRWR